MLEQMWILSRIIPMTYSDSLVCLGSPIRATHVSMHFVIQVKKYIKIIANRVKHC